jgi:hypothetical protein
MDDDRTMLFGDIERAVVMGGIAPFPCNVLAIEKKSILRDRSKTGFGSMGLSVSSRLPDLSTLLVAALAVGCAPAHNACALEAA